MQSFRKQNSQSSAAGRLAVYSGRFKMKILSVREHFQYSYVNIRMRGFLSEY